VLPISEITIPCFEYGISAGELIPLPEMIFPSLFVEPPIILFEAPSYNAIPPLLFPMGYFPVISVPI